MKACKNSEKFREVLVLLLFTSVSDQIRSFYVVSDRIILYQTIAEAVTIDIEYSSSVHISKHRVIIFCYVHIIE